MKRVSLFFVCTLLSAISCTIESDIIFTPEIPVEPEIPIEPEIPVEPGLPGIVIEIVEGIANVIAQYVHQDKSEFVRWQDGAVAYIVYDDKGEPASNAVVKGLPSIPDKEYVADSEGRFIVSKEDLPIGIDIQNRFGVTTAVTYINSKGETITEKSAYNTYVPHKIEVKLQVSSAPYLKQDHTLLGVEVLRKIDHVSDWESIPGYLGDLHQWVYSYELSDPLDVESFNESSRKINQQFIDISGMREIYIYRPTKQSIYYTPGYQASALGLWDEQDHYFNLQLNSYYGESPHANVSIQQAPIQFCPYIQDVICENYQTLGNSRSAVFSLWGEYIVDKFDYSLVFEELYVQNGQFYKPQIMDKAKADNDKMLMISFSENSEGSTADVSTTIFSSVNTPGFEILERAIYNGSQMSISCVNHMFRNTGKMSRFTGNPTTGFKISTEGYDPERYVAPTIDITYLP